MTKLEKIKVELKIRKLKHITKKIIKLRLKGDPLAEELTKIYNQL